LDRGRVWVRVWGVKAQDRITFNAQVMGGLRVTVGTLTGLMATGHTRAEILKLYPYLEEEDINQALKYAAWRAEEVELPLQPA